jgi:cobalt-zinc-cadmium efflux system outer membrane protein
MRRWATPLLGCALLVRAHPASADDTTLERALALARERAPALLAARARVAEAEGRRVGAAVLFATNPVLELAGGPRDSDEGDTTDWEVALSQDLEIGGRRAARIDAAEADVAGTAARSADAERRLLRDVAIAFWGAVAASERIRLEAADETDARRTLAAVERRVELGDAPALEENASRVAHARARAAALAAEIERAERVGDLRRMLGLADAEPIEPVGDLAADRAYDLAALLAGLDARPDLHAVSAELARAEADLRLGRAMAWPEVGASAAYAREEGDTIARGGVRIGLPVFERGQGVRAEAAARAVRLRHALAARKRAAEIEVRVAYERRLRNAEAVAILERDALPALADNDALARKSFAAGELGLLEWLALRREAIAARRDHVDRRLAAVWAATELEAAAGVLR